jgi:hypothetical protein
VASRRLGVGRNGCLAKRESKDTQTRILILKPILPWPFEMLSCFSYGHGHANRAMSVSLGSQELLDGDSGLASASSVPAEYFQARLRPDGTKSVPPTGKSSSGAHAQRMHLKFCPSLLP